MLVSLQSVLANVTLAGSGGSPEVECVIGPGLSSTQDIIRNKANNHVMWKQFTKFVFKRIIDHAVAFLFL